MSAINDAMGEQEIPDFGKMKKEELVKYCEDLSSTERLRQESEKAKQDERQRDWGQQFDMWLIRAARKEKEVEFGVLTDEFKLVDGVPIRIDKYHVQIRIEGREVWFNKSVIVSCSFPA